ncbi:MAG: flagellar motor switch protein FliG [Treponema sp.]|jgi:flagellar motor switch protein FliG|nr:flagellar motor switch protein FliG [Treponema sp.]
MGRFKDPKNKPNAAGGAAGKAAASQGIAAYQRILKPQDRSGDDPVPGLLKTGTGLLKTGTPPKPLPRTLPQPLEAGEDTKYRRVAKFLILIGGDEAAGILSRLDIEQVEAVSREIASIRGISSEEARIILDEFRSLLSAPYGYSGSSSGGVEEARRLLYAAFGPEKGESFLLKAVPGAKENPLKFLEDFSGEQIALLLRDESPAAAALVLSRLPSQVSAAALGNTSGARKLEIIKRIARLGETSPEVLDQAAAALREKARHIGDAAGHTGTGDIDGRNALAAILKSSDISFGDRILEELEDHDPDLGRDLKERLYTLEDVVKAEDRPLQEKLRAMSDKEIVLLLKGRSEEFNQKIFANLSSHRQAQVREEAEVLGPVPKKDADAAAGDFLAWFRLNREEGRILLIDSEDVII